MPEQFIDQVDVHKDSTEGVVVIRLNAQTGRIKGGGGDEVGRIWLYPAGGDLDTNAATIKLNAGTTGSGSSTIIKVGGHGTHGNFTILDNNEHIRAEVTTDEINMQDAGGTKVFQVNAAAASLIIGANGNEGDIEVQDGSGRSVFHVNGSTAWLRVGANGNEGDIEVQDGSGRRVFHMNGSNAWLRVGANGNEGDIEVQDGSGRGVFHMDGNNAWLRVGASGNEGDIEVQDGSGRRVFHMNGSNAWLRVGASGNEGDIEVHDGAGRSVFHMDGNNAWLRVGASGNEGDIEVLNNNGDRTIHLNGDTGDIILSNADFAEDFDVLESVTVEPGTVMVLESSGKLVPCSRAYDKHAVGVISGAGQYKPAIILDKQLGQERRSPIAMVGKVYCKVDATYGPIQMGDMLTTSATEGFARKADDPIKAFGAVIGKALKPLDSGRGLIPILVNLQ